MTIEERFNRVNEHHDEIARHGNRMAALGVMIGILVGFAAAGLLLI